MKLEQNFILHIFTIDFTILAFITALIGLSFKTSDIDMIKMAGQAALVILLFLVWINSAMLGLWKRCAASTKWAKCLLAKRVVLAITVGIVVIGFIGYRSYEEFTDEINLTELIFTVAIAIVSASLYICVQLYIRQQVLKPDPNDVEVKDIENSKAFDWAKSYIVGEQGSYIDKTDVKLWPSNAFNLGDIAEGPIPEESADLEDGAEDHKNADPEKP